MELRAEDGSEALTRARDERLGYRPALDGLRAFAILPVVVLHYSEKRWLPGGWLGVNLFFVLSGFLITRLLVEEHDQRCAVSLRNFYRRRVARLVPALVAVCAFVGVVAAFTGAYGTSVPTGMVATLTYTANWVAISRGFGALGPFAALWSLALEEQYYLLWAIAFVALVKFIPRAALARGPRGRRSSHSSRSRSDRCGGSGTALYAGTLGQGMAFLLAGSALALAVPLGPSLAASPIGRAACRYWWFAVAIVSTFVAFFAIGDNRAFYPTGGLALIAVCMIVILVAALVDTPLARLARAGPLVFLGRRSYAIYLWHVPVYEGVAWMRPGLSPASLALVSAISTLGVATLSWHLVERPLRTRLRPAETVDQSRRLNPA